MPVYFNPTNGDELKIKELQLPKFAKQYLTYLFAERNLAPRTIFDYSVTLMTFFRWIRMLELGNSAGKFQEIDPSVVTIEQVASITRADIADFLAFCMETLHNAASTRAVKLSALKSFYKYLSHNTERFPGVAISDPTLEVPMPKQEKKLPKYLNVEEAKTLLRSIDGPDKERDYCMILWFVTCGMRLSELVGIDMKDIKDTSVLIRGKGRKERMLYLNKSCKAALDDYLLSRSLYKRGEEEPALFISKRTGKRLTPRRVEQIVENYLLKAGFSTTDLHTHSLRHSAASNLLNTKAGDIVDAQELLGHESIATTRIYLHTLEDGIKRSLDQMDVYS